MANEWLINELTGLERRISILLSQHAEIKKELQQLKTEKQALIEEREKQKKVILSFENQLKFSKIAQELQQSSALSSETSTFSSTEALSSLLTEETSQANNDHSSYMQLLDKYISQIDKCISYLEQ